MFIPRVSNSLCLSKISGAGNGKAIVWANWGLTDRLAETYAPGIRRKSVVPGPFDKLRAGPFDKLRAGSFDKLRGRP